MGLNAVLSWKGVVRAFQTNQVQVVDRNSHKLNAKEVNVKVIFYLVPPTARMNTLKRSKTITLAQVILVSLFQALRKNDVDQ